MGRKGSGKVRKESGSGVEVERKVQERGRSMLILNGPPERVTLLGGANI